MKKIIYSVATMALAFFSVSCQQENLEPVAGGTTVTYTVKVPDAIATKAIGDQITDVDKVYYEVYRAAEVDELTKSPVYEGSEPVTGNQASFDLEFVRNQEFVVLFWAQNSSLVNTDVTSQTGMYNIDDLRAIKLVNPGAANNEASQVFAGSDRVANSTSEANGNVTLTRPVSQINVYTTTESLSFGNVTIGINTSSMTVAGLYNTFNVAEGDAVAADENKATFTYATAPVPTATADNAAHKYVAMNYVGFAPKAGATVDVDFTIKTTEAEDIEHSVSNVPVKPNYRTNIVGNLITATTDYNVSLNDDWATAEITYATNAEAAQAALDNATAGTVIKLHPGVNYGTLIFRKTASSTVVDITDAGGDAAGNEKYRRIEDLTIIGAEGAIVDGFDFQVGWISGSGASYIDIKNLTVKNVTFSGNTTPFNFEGSKGSALGIDGLNIVDCKMNDANNNNRFVFQQISGYKVLNDKTTNEYVMTAGIKNLTITGCEITGAYQVIESRAMENLAITNNTFRGIKARDMLITSDVTHHPNTTYTGNVTVTGNQSFDGEERFVRASLNNSDAVVVITGNTINNYMGPADFIKVSGANNVTVENNTLASIGAQNATVAQAALDNAVPGTTIQLEPGVNYGTLKFRANPGHANTTLEDIADAWAYNYNRSIKDITIIGAEGAKVNGFVFETGALPGDCNNRVTVNGLVIDGVEFTDEFTASSAGYNAPIMITTSSATINGLTVKNCKLIGDNNKLNLVYLYGADGSKNVSLINNKVDGIARLCELRGTENVTLTGNVIKNTNEHAMLLTGGGYDGNVTITGNTADGIRDRFVRMAGAGDAAVVITGNTINNYQGDDADYIKVTDGDNVTIENNTFVASTSHNLQKLILNATDGAIFELAEGNHGVLDFTHTYNGGKINAKNITIQGVEGTVVSNLVSPDGGNQIINWTIKGIKFDGTGVSQKGIDIRSGGNGLNVENCKFINGANIYVNNNYEGITIKKCDFEQSTTGGVYCQKVKDVAIDECKFVNMPYNAIQLSGAGVSGTVSITNNTISNCVSRAMRLVTVDGATLDICNNTMTDSNNASDNNVSDRGQVIKITGAVLSGNFDNNTHNGSLINFTDGIAM